MTQSGAGSNSLIFQYGDGTAAARNVASVTQGGVGGHNSVVVQVGHNNMASVIQNN